MADAEAVTTANKESTAKNDDGGEAASEIASDSGDVSTGNQSKAEKSHATEEVYFDDEEAEESSGNIDAALAEVAAMEDKMAGVVLDGVHLQELIDIDLAAVVLDCGSANWSVGFGGEDSPRSIFPSVLGRPKKRKRLGSTVGTGAVAAELAGDAVLEEACYLGDEFEKHDDPDSLVADFPLRHGRVKSWEDMEMLLGYTYMKHAQVNPEEHPLLITEAPRNPRSNREKLSELLFETFQVPAMFVAVPAMLSMYSSGRVRGLAVDVGHGYMHSAAIFDGNPIPNTVQRSNVAGSLLDQCLAGYLAEQGVSGILRNHSGQQFIRELKANKCYVKQLESTSTSESTVSETGEDGESSEKPAPPTPAIHGPEEFLLPDGTAVTLEKELHLCPEALFDPSLLNLGVAEEDSPGIQKLAFSSIQKCDIDIRKEMYTNIVLSGRTTQLDGFLERFEAEIVKQAPAAAQVRVTAPADREQTVWVGGSILAQLDSFENTWVPRKTYQEEGASTMLRRCPY